MFAWTGLRKSIFLFLIRSSDHRIAIPFIPKKKIFLLQRLFSSSASSFSSASTNTSIASSVITSAEAIREETETSMAPPPPMSILDVEGLLAEIAVRVDDPLRKSAARILATHVDIPHNCTKEEPDLPEIALSVKEHFLNIDISRKKEARNEICAETDKLLAQEPSHHALFAIAFSTALIAIEGSRGASQQLARFAASAITAQIDVHTSTNDHSQSESDGQQLFTRVIFTLISSKANMTADLHIVAALAKALRVDACPSANHASLLSTRIAPDLNGQNNQTLAAALAISSQLCPWEAIPPTELINVAVLHKLWHAAERIAQAAIISSRWSLPSSAALIDGAYYQNSFRKADKYATRFFTNGGYTRLLDARFMHARDTIQKITSKGSLRLIERQAEIIETTVAQLRTFYKETLRRDPPPIETVHGSTTMDTAVQQIREFALKSLEHYGDTVGIAHLVTVWDMEHSLDAETLRAAQAQRQETYIQWKELMGDLPVPEVITTPEMLRSAFQQLLQDQSPFYGFDTEWGDDDDGVALLQIASSQRAILIDIPLLSQSEEGVRSLEETIGKFFADSTKLLIGFACKGDVSKIKSTPCVSNRHWMGDATAVVDLQGLVSQREQVIGLSRCCELYLGKPMDKLEQCSAWMKRPLSLSQRTYAALDALACVLIYQKVVAGVTRDRSDGVRQ